MSPRYLVIKEQQCPLCAGDGWTTPAVYRNLNDHMIMWEQRNPNYGPSQWEAEKIAYMHSHGYPYDWPPEEVACDNCDCTGIVRMEIDLCEALEAINA